MDREEVLMALKQCHTGDEQIDHSNADRIIMGFLAELGYADIVMEWESIDKWYA